LPRQPTLLSTEASKKDMDARDKREHEAGGAFRSRRSPTMAEFSLAAKSIVSREKAIVS
jgi:hypothetical protein